MAKVSFELGETELLTLLCEMISQISEQCWCAGWLSGAEEDVPAACRAIVKNGSPVLTLGMWSLITLGQATVMCALADSLGSWVDMDGQPYHPSCDLTC